MYIYVDNILDFKSKKGRINFTYLSRFGGNFLYSKFHSRSA
jgi:hypothetical protein